jgi:hypothetical protein
MNPRPCQQNGRDKLVPTGNPPESKGNIIMAKANQLPAGPTLAPPPPSKSLDSIDLDALKGHIVAVRVLDRIQKETKFGPRPMSTLELVTSDSAEPVVGVNFSSYFSQIPMYVWYVGKIASVRRGKMDAWTMEAVTDKKAIAALQAVIATLPEINGTEGL